MGDDRKKGIVTRLNPVISRGTGDRVTMVTILFHLGSKKREEIVPKE